MLLKAEFKGTVINALYRFEKREFLHRTKLVSHVLRAEVSCCVIHLLIPVELDSPSARQLSQVGVSFHELRVTRPELFKPPV